MYDQVMALKTAGDPTAYITSYLSASQLQMVYRNMREEKYKLAYAAPDQLDREQFSESRSGLCNVC